ncbi:terminase small subunit [Xenorhabdus thuongxuanensis]|uniref:terminase small subunit n=1 Tax=Xenorhabdus thuongxuanensis TaxID=1873484 RepID=UPI0039EE4AEF
MKLINKGLTGDFNSTIAKMMLTKHGYSDKQEIDHRSPDGSMSPAKIVLVAGGQHDDSEN